MSHRTYKNLFIIEPVHVISPPSRRSSRIPHPTERYLSILIEDIEKIFLMRDREHRDDPNTTTS